MDQSNASKPGIVFWVVAIIALLWNAMGCLNLFQQMSPAGLATLPAEYQSFIETRPSWALIGFVVSVIAGLVGAFALMMRSRVSVTAFALSAIGALVATIPTLGLSIPSLMIGSAMSIILACAFAWYSSYKLKR